MACNQDGQYADMLDELRTSQRQGALLNQQQRIHIVKQIRRLITENTPALFEALSRDLGRQQEYINQIEIQPILESCDKIFHELGQWMAPDYLPTPSHLYPAQCYVRPEAKGVVLVISPWNFPLTLCLIPIVEAIAAGNTVLCKPSEVAEHSSAILAELFPKYVNQKIVRIVEGAVPETTALLKLKFDHIFYTGNGTVARIVARAAAEHLTPTTLELGGQNPAIVDANLTDLNHTARSLVYSGILSNAGQVCVCTNYILVHKDIKKDLCEALLRAVEQLYGEDPKQSTDLSRIINERHWKRIMNLLSGQQVLCGGVATADESTLYIPPTFVLDPTPDSPIMQDEIFGPVTSIVSVESMDEAITFVNSRAKPLSLTCYTSSKKVMDQVELRTSSGSITINDHAFMGPIGYPDMPFGGVGESGSGAYHGKNGFDEFSHFKPVVNRSTGFLSRMGQWVGLPPMTKSRGAFVTSLMGYKKPMPTWMKTLLFGIAVAVALRLSGNHRSWGPGFNWGNHDGKDFSG